MHASFKNWLSNSTKEEDLHTSYVCCDANVTNRELFVDNKANRK